MSLIADDDLTEGEHLRQLASTLVYVWRLRPPVPFGCKTETSEIMRLFRPYVEQAILGGTPKPIRDATDRRERMWHVSLELWKGTPGHIDTLVAQSEGRTKKEDGSIAAYGGEAFKGLGALANYIADGAEGCDAPADFYFAPIFKALGYLRPSFTKGKGHATMRRTSADGRWHLICDVFKEGSFPNE